MFRNRVVPYLEGPDASGRVREIAELFGGRGGRDGVGDPEERFRALAEGLAIMEHGVWDEGREAATLLDMRIPAKLYEPGDEIEVSVSPLWEREDRFKQHYLVEVGIVDNEGGAMGEPGKIHLHAPADKTVALTVPEGAPEGRYAVRYSIAAHHGDNPEPLLQGDRTFFVVGDLRTRLAALESKLHKVQSRESEGRRLEPRSRW